MIHFTTLEQSKKLLDLGINPITCDATYYPYEAQLLRITQDKAITNNLFSFRNGYVVPCWSDGALMELLAKDNQIEITMKLVPYGKEFKVTLLHTTFKSAYLTEALLNALCWVSKTKK